MVIKSVLMITTVSLLLAFAGQQSSNPSAGYRGIVPLQSTRADVERVLGRPRNPDDNTYYLRHEIVAIGYSKYGCAAPPRVPGWPVPPIEGWNVPADTVLAIRVTLRKQVPLESLGLDLSRFKKERGDFDTPTHFMYVDRERGVTVDLNGDGTKEVVRGFIYEPEAKYNSFRCPATQWRA
jgi:hypothetical protein